LGRRRKKGKGGAEQGYEMGNRDAPGTWKKGQVRGRVGEAIKNRDDGLDIR